MVTLLRSSERKIHFNTGTPPFGLHFASQGIGRRLGRDYACITLRSACSDIPACILSSLRDYAFGLWGGKKKTAGVFDGPRLSGKKAATYSPTVRSTIGAFGLNFSVRNGKRWNPGAIATKMSY